MTIERNPPLGYNIIMSSRRRQNNSTNSSGDNNQVLALALFIMLLAFFIVLSTLSSFQEEKIESIMGSIENTFATKADSIYLRRPSVSSFTSDTAQDGQANRLEELETLFNSQITSISMEVDPEKGTMWVRVDYDAFYKAIASLGNGPLEDEEGEELPSFLPTLVSLLRTNSNNTVYRMDIILNTVQDAVTIIDNDVAAFRSQRNKVGLLSRLLEEEGLPPRQMSIGLTKGDANTLDLVFRPYRAFDTLQERETGAEENNSSAGGIL